MTDLTTQLQSITHPGLFAEVIRKEVKAKPDETIGMIASQIKDNRTLVVEIVGEHLVCLIEKLEA